MKKLIIGLGGCGNNIINLLQDKIDDSFKTLSIQKDLQLLAISQANFKLNPKDNDFEKKLNTLLQYSNKVILVLGAAGTSSLLYFENLVVIFRKNRVLFNIIALQSFRIENTNKQEISKKTSLLIRQYTKNYEFIRESNPEKHDIKAVNLILEYSINLRGAIEKIKENKLCISDAYGIGSCSTCGCMEADRLVKKIENIEDELIQFNIDDIISEKAYFSSYRDMPIELNVIIFIYYRVTFNKEKVLNFWLENLKDKNIRFFDVILFYVLKQKPFSENIKNKWIKRCESLVEKYNDRSLRETIRYCKSND
ncbi:hypothetical protein GCM10012288_03460 [Malaciobacter pacificus]|uniref:Uncharacterized protein n=1 Tax=Malaciobacter pacificus TaxID=1080223 RepID=A0A5C2H928_9BACT|nr:hypothetical protein [Malaciobacter pacificus]QEP33726.1 hypothetical protein APAC_0577 [Malaciobacter pacificus]GGD32853.1 hypothetical protein GCM10012288_03460 [Malaciobacter pacificus]